MTSRAHSTLSQHTIWLHLLTKTPHPHLSPNHRLTCFWSYNCCVHRAHRLLLHTIIPLTRHPSLCPQDTLSTPNNYPQHTLPTPSLLRRSMTPTFGTSSAPAEISSSTEVTLIHSKRGVYYTSLFVEIWIDPYTPGPTHASAEAVFNYISHPGIRLTAQT